jgi:hypothetical protein
MDTLAHGLWGGMLAGWRKRFGLAFLFGVAPDVLSFGLLMLIRAVQGRMQMGKPDLHAIPGWVYSAYDCTHSLILVGAVWGILWWKYRELAVPFSAWIIHIVFDIPTHSRAFFPTPFLFPLSHYTVDGISWGQKWFMILNYTCLAGVAILFIRSRRKQRAKDSYEVRRIGAADGAGKDQAGEPLSSKSA